MSDSESPCPNEFPILDLAAPLDRLAGDHELLRTLSQMFAEDLPACRRNILSARDEGDFEQIARLTHSLKSTAASIGAMRLAELAHRVSTAAYADERDKVLALLPPLDETIGSTLQILPH